MFERRVSEVDVEHVLATGEVIVAYPDDTPYPIRLLLGHVGTRPLHVVVADDVEGDRTVIVTAYEPDPALWSHDFRRRLVR